MYWRYQVDNFFVTTMADDQTLTPWVDWVLNVRDLPNIESWKIFYVVFRVDNVDTRFSLPVYVDEDRLRYRWYDVKQVKTLDKNDTVSVNDLAGDFNFIFDNINDIWYIIKKDWLNILVYGWNIIRGWVSVTIADANLTLTDNTTQYVVFDFSDSTIKSVTALDNLSHYCFAEIVTLWWEIASMIIKRPFCGWESFSNAFFERNGTTWAIQIKNNVIKKANIDLTTLTTDDLAEWNEHKYFSSENSEILSDVNSKKHTHSNKTTLDTITPELLNSYQTKGNLKQNLANPNTTTYPSTQAVATAIETEWVWNIKYSEFGWYTDLSSTIVISHPNTETTTSNNIRIVCWNPVKEWMVYLLKVSASSSIGITLWTWITNPQSVSLDVAAWESRIFTLLATWANSLEIQWIAIWDWVINIYQWETLKWTFTTNWAANVNIQIDEWWFTWNQIFSTVLAIDPEINWWTARVEHWLWKMPKFINIEWYSNFWVDDKWRNTVSRYMASWNTNEDIDVLWTLIHLSDWTERGILEPITDENFPLTILAWTQYIDIDATLYTKVRVTAYL